MEMMLSFIAGVCAATYLQPDVNGEWRFFIAIAFAVITIAACVASAKGF